MAKISKIFKKPQNTVKNTLQYLKYMILLAKIDDRGALCY